MIQEDDESCPQLDLFKKTSEAEKYINLYIYYIFFEFQNRQSKVNIPFVDEMKKTVKVSVTSGQINFEKQLLLSTYRLQNDNKISGIDLLDKLKPHPMFNVVNGEPESWTQQMSPGSLSL
ncbi:MAG: hypothetical protein OEZ34_16955 [Spirochaetia bacterium]|nr:hypothetical protein [Spirochaetia bacterium]